MSPRSSEQYEEIRETKRKHILNTACKLFANHGYYDTSISMITKQAGISKGLIYNYFEGKEQLLKSLVFEGLNEFHKNFDIDHDGILSNKEFEIYIDNYFRLLDKNREFWRLYFAIIIQPPVLRLVEKEMMEFGAPMVTILFNYFKDNNYEDPQAEMEFFIAILSGVAIKYLNAPEYFHLEKLKKKIVSLYPNNKKGSTTNLTGEK